MLLRFSRHQIMYNVSYVVLCAEVIYKGTLSYSNKAKNKMKHYTSDPFLNCFRFMRHSRVSNHSFCSLFQNLPTLLCCIDLEISP